MKYINKILCKLGFHKWINIDKSPFPKLKPGEIYCYSDLHKCLKCGKEQYLGMGCLM